MGDNDVPRPFVPEDFVVPIELLTDSFRLQPLGPEHNAADYAAWMSSIEHIRATPGFENRSWPDPKMTLADNLGDMKRHAEDFATRSGFTFTVLTKGSGDVVGCVYVYPSATEGAADVRSWVRSDLAKLDLALYDDVSKWLREAWPFTTIHYAPRQYNPGSRRFSIA